MTDTSSSPDDNDNLQTLQDILEHGNDWFRIEGPFEAEMEAAKEGRRLDLVRLRGQSLSRDFIDMALSWDGDTAAKDLVRSEMRAQVLHEIALIEAAEKDVARPAVERIEARQIWKIIPELDEYALSRLAARLERAFLPDQPAKPVECGDAAPGLTWRIVSSPVERWILGRETPHPAACDAFWVGGAIVSGRAELWVLERNGSSEFQPFLQVLVDSRPPGIAAILGRAEEVPEDSVLALIEPLIRAESLKPWRVRREDNDGLWPAWYDAEVLESLRDSYTADHTR